MPGVLGAASFGPRRIDALPFDRVLARLRHALPLATTTVSAPDRRAALGVVDLGLLRGSGSAATHPDGSLAVVHG